MMHVTSRAYSGNQDLKHIVDLLETIRTSDLLANPQSIIEMHELLNLNKVQDNTRLWFDSNGQIVGFALVDHYNNLRFNIDRQGQYPDIESEIVAWGVKCIRHAMQHDGEPLTLDASCSEDDIKRISLLIEQGFVVQEVQTLRFVRKLANPIPEARLPPGFWIRNVAGEGEVEKLVELHRSAFGTKYMTVEERLAMMRMPEYDADLDLLVISPKGRFAAYCICSISREENERTGRNEGYAEPIATHPEFQRRGLAKALLLKGFHKLALRGIDRAVLSTNINNAAMLRTAKAVGFRKDSTTIWFSKLVSPNQLAG